MRPLCPRPAAWDAPPVDVLERERELQAIERLLEDARAGRGGAHVLAAAPGLGKSTLAERAAESAEGLRVLRAAGRELEHEYGWGVARALFEAHVAADGLPAGPAGAAGPLFAEPAGEGPAASEGR